ncbi:hypothetical protein [Streptomyces cellostaticus]|uniref:hypothetical protein n=1 Tax=Streptomyces cellostaticus TaxID=67285 RepID=UPI00131D088A|nr:hypothetical protein [Streptomyces cellostaticus]
MEIALQVCFVGLTLPSFGSAAVVVGRVVLLTGAENVGAFQVSAAFEEQQGLGDQSGEGLPDIPRESLVF